ncbi:MAG: hypothetical protein H6742_14765 [Alphaproteobacteria bacterium]|nr:hypothetical protein [Alphaproteobacteria bacterium]
MSVSLIHVVQPSVAMPPPEKAVVLGDDAAVQPDRRFEVVCSQMLPPMRSP